MTTETARFVYCGGNYVPEQDARLSIFDRGTLFGDAVYEVTAVIDGRMIDNSLHLDRLERSLAALDIPLPCPRAEIAAIQNGLITRNALMEGTVYLQISRGAADRDYRYADTLLPDFFAFTQRRAIRDTPAHRDGIAVALLPEPRWARRDIKTTMLLGQVLAKREARDAGCAEVWFVEDGMITEGASSTAFLITRDGAVVTRPNSRATLPGCTRRAVLDLCARHGLVFVERAFTPQEAADAAEAFLTSAGSLITPVVRIADTIIGDGNPGRLTRHLQRYYLDAVLGTDDR
ncbi:D-amino-acid transaminase [Acidomonas methanolica]|uniref:Probable branched-chain-amino-acid aminotransferase n=1 Tax=Acidomonas methanolica NBRC 104435 TaxID=1231351 RepID=A0A023D2T6_ACIMT|nr:D-amino-acid transaminase [Acidomonas methanolica]MBU2654531.1 D-amino-acid transaminase [Acidomonas methanolica]TCS27403.1 D-alanine transaminase [Acidomonas methanolica]GAJ28116.1 D-amino acid aminotransferase [Acidomonas methanolica NBRC 104435]GBQ46514.1 branched-chain amino acid aminotransferase [Acidomonas methanolica]GEK98690.1 D-amino acid aminotransferase [Acidomonas methanolica NBRC 104435]